MRDRQLHHRDSRKVVRVVRTTEFTVHTSSHLSVVLFLYVMRFFLGATDRSLNDKETSDHFCAPWIRRRSSGAFFILGFDEIFTRIVDISPSWACEFDEQGHYLEYTNGLRIWPRVFSYLAVMGSRIYGTGFRITGMVY